MGSEDRGGNGRNGDGTWPRTDGRGCPVCGAIDGGGHGGGCPHSGHRFGAGRCGVVQVVVMDGLRPALETWLASRGLALFLIPTEDDPLPTYGIATGTPPGCAHGWEDR